MEEYNLKEVFIEYWNNVINLWLKGKGGILEDALRGKEECYYKDGKDAYLYVNIEEKQSYWFKEESLRKLLCPIHMPEPYWGNPEKCSIVIVNYNPAGGTDMNPHTYRGEGKSYPVNTMIEYVNGKGYSELALDFPLLHSVEQLRNDTKGRWWLRSYGGREWWRGKIAWMRHLIIDSPETTINEEKWPAVDDKKEKYEWPDNKEETPYPFAIELCGWHSPKWPNNTKAIKKNNQLKDTIRDKFVVPLLLSIEKAQTHIAVCIGAQFKPSILREYIECCQGVKLLDVTLAISSLIDEKWNVEAKEKESYIGVAVAKDYNKDDQTKRYYRVYNVVDDNKVDHIILNTFAPGGNHHPADHFWPFEKELLGVINKKEEWKKKEDLFR